MKVVSHVLELRKKHLALSEAVEEAQKSLAIDDLQVTNMKKQKLRIKEAIHKLSSWALALFTFCDLFLYMVSLASFENDQLAVFIFD